MSHETLSMDEFLTAVELDLDSYVLAIRSSLKSPTTFIRRLPSEVRVNNYNVYTVSELGEQTTTYSLCSMYMHVHHTLQHTSLKAHEG